MTVALHVESVGLGPSVLLIPGLGYASWCWREQAPRADGWQLWKVDPRGAGRSPKPDGPYTIAGMAEDIAATVGDHGPFHVVGHSLVPGSPDEASRSGAFQDRAKRVPRSTLRGAKS